MSGQKMKQPLFQFYPNASNAKILRKNACSFEILLIAMLNCQYQWALEIKKRSQSRKH